MYYICCKDRSHFDKKVSSNIYAQLYFGKKNVLLRMKQEFRRKL